MIVGFVFLIMATIAYVADEYGDSLPTDEDGTITNESVTRANLNAGAHALSGTGACNAENFAVTEVNNGTDTFNSGNYTISDGGSFNNASAVNPAAGWNVSYTYDYSGVSCNVTNNLQTELDDNTSIAGVILTISLIGIVLTVLIGIFLASRRGF
jgi:hypothetical protein